MQSAEVFQFDRLMAPISADAPTGIDLRNDDSPAYWEIKDARKKAREIEDAVGKGADPDPKTPLDWNKVLKPCLQALEEKTKDLEIAAYVLEAAFRVHGVAGLRDGFRLARELVETYWDDLYPSFDLEADPPNPEPRKSPATRVNTLGGVNGSTLVGPVERLPVARSARLGDFSYLQYKDAGDRQRDAVLETIQQAANETTAKYYQVFVADLRGANEEFTKLTAALDERCGGESPPSTRMAELLEAALDCATKLAGDKLKPPDDPGSDTADLSDGGGTTESGTFRGPDVLQSREDAFRTLKKVADYFRRAEPHSVVSYALEQVIEWGKKPLPELLSELISSDDARRELFKLVGIKPPESPPSE